MRLIAGLPETPTVTVPAAEYELLPNATRVRVDAPGPGVLVLTEMYVARGLTAQVNGAPVQVFRVNHVARGVRIPGEGRWSVEFRYRPESWSVALALSAFGGLMMIAVVAASLRTTPAPGPR